MDALPWRIRGIVGTLTLSGGQVIIPCGRPASMLRLLSILFCLCFIVLVLNACGDQSQPDPRLKNFHVLSSRITMLDNQAEVDGTVQNNGTENFPFDVTLIATFYDSAGNVVGQAQGVGEDIWPGMTRPFVLLGQVDSSKFSRMSIEPISLRERRNEKNLPSPPPVVP
jgi:hypothetical protein